MHNKYGVTNKCGKKVFPLYLVMLTLFFYAVPMHSQIKPNMEVFYNLVDSASINVSKNTPATKKNVKLDLGTGDIYTVFNNRIIGSLQNAGKIVMPGGKYDTSATEVSFKIDKTTVNYGELFQQKLFGDFYAQREISLSGNYLLFLPGVSSHSFSFSYTDTVNINEIKNLENNAFPFTQGRIPSEPLFASIYEPVIVIGAAALTVILFFTIRSK
jgi:hypothetical protein